MTAIAPKTKAVSPLQIKAESEVTPPAPAESVSKVAPAALPKAAPTVYFGGKPWSGFLNKNV